jgi:Uma2 family endonuclease
LPSPSGITDTVVQPDITVICDPSKIAEQGCTDAPDLVVEVVSKSSIRKDLHEKYFLYEKSGIKEYWIVYPAERSLTIFTLTEKGVYLASKPLTRGDRVVSTVIPGLLIDLDEIFPDTVEEPEEGYGSAVRRV